uniref:Prokineticin domain-containing protein n=1 Tax=Strigamia maritima TaxID=126957 RepID=T1JBT5_STRMM
MKYIYYVAFLAVCTVSVNANSCNTQMDCKPNECCKNFGLFKRCLYLRGEGETCSGKFLCDCKIGLMCQSREKNFWNTFKIGTGICTTITNTAVYREW